MVLNARHGDYFCRECGAGLATLDADSTLIERAGSPARMVRTLRSPPDEAPSGDRPGEASPLADAPKSDPPGAS